MRRFTLIAAAVSFLAAAPALAAQDEREVTQSMDQEWVSLTGTVATAGPERFTLDYGRGDILIDLDQAGWYGPGVLLPGDRVTVVGRVDKDFYEHKKVEASSVYVDKLDRFFFAEPADEEAGWYATYLKDNVPEGAEMAMTGRVVARRDGELTLSTGGTQIKVDMSGIARARPKRPHVNVGDRISVVGEMEARDFFEGRKIIASSVAVLDAARR